MTTMHESVLWLWTGALWRLLVSNRDISPIQMWIHADKTGDCNEMNVPPAHWNIERNLHSLIFRVRMADIRCRMCSFDGTHEIIIIRELNLFFCWCSFVGFVVSSFAHWRLAWNCTRAPKVRFEIRRKKERANGSEKDMNRKNADLTVMHRSVGAVLCVCAGSDL